MHNRTYCTIESWFCSATTTSKIMESWFRCAKFYNGILIPFDHENKMKILGSVSAKSEEREQREIEKRKNEWRKEKREKRMKIWKVEKGSLVIALARRGQEQFIGANSNPTIIFHLYVFLWLGYHGEHLNIIVARVLLGAPNT